MGEKVETVWFYSYKLVSLYFQELYALVKISNICITSWSLIMFTNQMHH